ncbi:arpin-like [Amphiura filiformis]|uniref:arpin-like n=1 Tax=Amphiura filiformis TaxID=82378 RepID=UPI003B21109A
MSRIYDNRSLQTIPVLNQQWNGRWDPKSQWQTGNGVLLEGVLMGRSRHVITDSTNNKCRYYALHIKVNQAHKRKFDSKGVEIEPNFSETQKVNTGYLMSSYKTEAKGKTDKLQKSEVEAIVNKPALLELTAKHRPANCLTFWVEEKEMDKIELENEDVIRIKTQGDGPFLFSVAKLDLQSHTVGNYAGGEEVGATWTDKVFAAKDRDSPQQSTSQEGMGADEDEWDD